jgi:hypothetical protein
MESKKTDINELAEKVLEGMKKALKKLVETKAKNNQDLIIGDKDGNIKSVPAKDFLHTVQK